MKNTLVIILLFVFCQSICHAQGERKRKFYDKGTVLRSPAGFYDDETYVASTNPNDNLLIGVATGNHNPRKKSDFVCTGGVSEVKYNYENGSIQEGDLVTSSSTTGEAMKATQSGIILGIALENTDSPSGLVKVRVLIQYVKL